MGGFVSRIFLALSPILSPTSGMSFDIVEELGDAFEQQRDEFITRE
ncbi:MAG TPA: hypothetical protein VEO95_06765 [Chthoniobacteraceae bacterium]|nr:hypothetical protein [Chthoniobacteraceae bacterium]